MSNAEFVMVPRVPTEEMIVAFAEAWHSKRQCIEDPDMLDAYAAMLAVAPEHRVEPVALPVSNQESEGVFPTGGDDCFEEIAKQRPLYPHAVVERLLAQVDKLKLKVGQAFWDKQDRDDTIKDLQARLAERDELIYSMRKELHALVPDGYSRPDDHPLSVSAEPSSSHSVETNKMVEEYEIAGYEGSSGLYYSRLAAVANGEQSVEPVYRVKK